MRRFGAAISSLSQINPNKRGDVARKCQAYTQKVVNLTLLSGIKNRPDFLVNSYTHSYSVAKWASRVTHMVFSEEPSWDGGFTTGGRRWRKVAREGGNMNTGSLADREDEVVTE
jgi:hypothetical protein